MGSFGQPSNTMTSIVKVCLLLVLENVAMVVPACFGVMVIGVLEPHLSSVNATSAASPSSSLRTIELGLKSVVRSTLLGASDVFITTTASLMRKISDEPPGLWPFAKSTSASNASLFAFSPSSSDA